MNLCAYLWESFYIKYFEVRRFVSMVNCNIPWNRVFCQIKKGNVSWAQPSVSTRFLTMDPMWPPASWSEHDLSCLSWTGHPKCEPKYILPSSYFSSSSFLFIPQNWENELIKKNYRSLRLICWWNVEKFQLWNRLPWILQNWLNR